MTNENENEKINQLEKENKRIKKQLDNHFTILQELGVLKDKWNEEIQSNAERITELEELVQSLNDEIDVMMDNNSVTNNMARAVCELQEQLEKQFPTIYIANKIDAVTRVGMK